MTATLRKTGKYWTIIIDRDDGTRNDYRFRTKKEATNWAKLAGVSI